MDGGQRPPLQLQSGLLVPLTTESVTIVGVDRRSEGASVVRVAGRRDAVVATAAGLRHTLPTLQGPTLLDLLTLAHLDHLEGGGGDTGVTGRSAHESSWASSHNSH